MVRTRRKLTGSFVNLFVKRWSKCGRTGNFEQENPEITEKTFWLFYAGSI